MLLIQTLVTYISELHYILKASLVVCCLYMPYYFLFSKDVTFTANRIYLLGTIALAVFVPLMGIDIFPILVTVSSATTNCMHCGQDDVSAQSYFIQNGFFIFYLAGLTWMVLKLMFRLYGMYNILKKANKTFHKGYTLAIVPYFPVSSFLNTILIPSNNTENILIEHEKIHIHQKHSIDIFIAELFKCLLWFHPLAYALRYSIALNHEYECDAKMSAIYTYEQYGYILLQHAQSKNQNAVINQFYSFTKKRIAMMSHQKNKQNLSYRYLMMIPILLTVFALFSFRPYYIPKSSPKRTVISLNDSIPVVLDTIITLDPETFVETVQIIKRKKDSKPLDVNKVIQMNQEIISYSDTIVTFDMNTYKEKVQVVTSKIAKGYKILIDLEYTKQNPDFKLIENWKKAGARY